ncbi:hypothetical protein CRE_31055 [Caenorhabditis remanei]|uniref:Uncharacterized protein n=1 Tax=Caenorhabditis remanei TaxID=31234 RepID=E3LUD2_CAERE|nr:hypothetical protein CRE_31055 [Caenorhabditis remanei]
MVPVIVDVWKALFNSISTPDTQGKTGNKDVITPVLTPVETESGDKNVNITFTAPAPSEIKDEKQPQKGFYIDYP